MLKKKITYTDFDGNKHSDDFFFNLSKPEVLEMNFEKEGGMRGYIERITREHDQGKLLGIFKELILKSYGEKSADGLRFEKSEEISRRFSHTRAYEELYMELVNSDEAAAAFINGIVPIDVAEAARQRAMSEDD